MNLLTSDRLPRKICALYFKEMIAADGPEKLARNHRDVLGDGLTLPSLIISV